MSILLVVVPAGSDSAYAAIQWSRIADLPQNHTWPAAAVSEGNIHIMGGYSGAGAYIHTEYDPATDQWTSRADLVGCSGYAMDGEILVGPGGQREIYAVGGRANYNDVLRYLLAEDRWETAASLPQQRGSALSTAVVDNLLYAVGGARDNYEYYATNEVYDRVNDQWLSRAPITRDGEAYVLNSAVEAVWDGKILLFGGTTVVDNAYVASMATLIYDPGTDSWSQGASLPRHRGGTGGAVAVGNLIYVLGGNTDGNIIDIYDPVGDVWQAAAEVFPGDNWHQPIIVSDGNAIYVLGDHFDYGGSGADLQCWVGIVPEPATLSLLALGGLALIRRRSA